MEPAVLTFAFDPVLQLTPTASVRLETLAIAAAMFLGLVLAAWNGRRFPPPWPGQQDRRPRAEDLLFIAVGAVPGAVIGARAGYVIDHLDYYRVNPGLITDFSQGGLSLTLAVPLGLLGGALIAWLIGAPVGRWLHAAAVPLLVTLALGKLAGVLGATGQGLPSDLSWATAYAGPGPWASLAPTVPSQPSQVEEAILVAAAILLVLAASRLEVVDRGEGAAMFLALGLWAMARLAVASTWRDPVEVGPFRSDQVLSLLVALVAVIGLVERIRAPVPTGWPDAGLEPRPGAELDPEPAE